MRAHFLLQIIWFTLVSTVNLGTPPTRAADGLFEVGGVRVELREVTPQVEVLYSAMRFNRILNVWNTEVTVRNQGNEPLEAPMVLQVTGLTGSPGVTGGDGMNEAGQPYFVCATEDGSALQPGAGTVPLTLSIQRGTESPAMTVAVYCGATADLSAALVQTLDAQALPLGIVEITETAGAEDQIIQSDFNWGVATLGKGAGNYKWKFSRDGYYPVWRTGFITGETVLEVPSPRLTLRSQHEVAISALDGGTISDAEGTIMINLGPGAVASNSKARLTPLIGQSLPAFLPLGWSPLQAFWFEGDRPLEMAVSANLKLWANPGVESLAVVRWDEVTLQWQIIELIAGEGSDRASIRIDGNGAYVIAIGDVGAYRPPMPVVGTPLAGPNLPMPLLSGLTAAGDVTPSERAASVQPELVTGLARVAVTNQAGAIPSGLVLPGEVTEKYALRSGVERRLPRYRTHTVFYQTPGDADPATLHSSFPVRPTLLFGGDELSEGTVRVDVLESSGFDGVVVGGKGGAVSRDGIRLLVGAEALNRNVPVEIRREELEQFSQFNTGAVEIVRVFTLRISDISPEGRLRLMVDGLESNTRYVLARLVTSDGHIGLEPAERYLTDSNGTLNSIEPETGATLDGIRGPGQFALAKVNVEHGLVHGTVRNALVDTQGGLLVRIVGQPWLTFSKDTGEYRLIAAVGPTELLLVDPQSGNEGKVSFELSSGGQRIDARAAETGPVVLLTTPGAGSENVSRVSSVEIQFSEAIDPATATTGNIEIIGGTNGPVAFSASLNLRGTALTLLPDAQLPADSEIVVRLSADIRDLVGLGLDGTREFRFKTETALLNRVAGEVVIYEPVDGVAAITGTSGVAEPEGIVILVNENTGYTATVTAKPDGSFTNSIPADVEDFLSAVVVNGNGTRTQIPASRQIFRDGGVGLYNQGGILEAESEGGPVQVIVEPGAIETKTRIKIEPINLTRLATALNTLPADGAVLLGGFSMAVEGDEFSVGADVSFPVDPGQLGLPPGVAPEEATYALTVPQELDDGTIAYEIIDQMHYEDGRLVTHSPPFAGVLLRQITKNMVSSKKLKLSNQILNALGLPGIQETITHQLMLPIMMAAGSSLRVAGRVAAAEFSGTGDIIPGTERLVPGALVTYHHEGIGGRPGRIRPGTTFATSDSNGRYAFLMPADLVSGPAGVVLIATHPQFFPQSAIGSATVANLAGALQTPVLGIPLFFTIIDDLPELGDDRIAPEIYFSQFPRDPSPGTNDSAGVTITVSARDDRETASLTLVVDDYKALNATTNISPVPAILNQVETTFGTVLRQKTFRLQSPIRGSLVVRAIANDPAGNVREAEFPVFFAGDRIYPDPSDDAPGPRLISSWPPDGTTAVQPGTPLTLRFSVPLESSSVQNFEAWLGAAGAKVSGIDLSVDRKVVTVWFTADLGADLAFTIRPELLGFNNKQFDQDPSVDGEQTQSVALTIVNAEEMQLPGIAMGGGVVVQGAYAYALERLGSLDGSLVVFDLSTDSPTKVAELSLPGYPRDIVMIPQYSYRLKENGDCVTGDLLAIIGGKVGAEAVQYLWVIDVSDPLVPRPLASTVVTFAISAVRKLQWSPPFVAYLDAGADVTSVALVNLQAFILGMNATASEIALWPAEGRAGTDVNIDGDYCDTGETVPLPFQTGNDFFGKDFTFTVNTTQRIEDFDLDADEGLVGLVLSEGLRRSSDGTPDPASPALPAYRTAMSGLGRPNPDLATVEFSAGDRPKRVALLPGVLLQEAEGAQSRRNLAVVSLATAGGDNQLVIIDISAVEAPAVLARLDISEFGVPQTLQRRKDGLLALATSTDVILFDPSKLTLAAGADGQLPAIVGRLPGMGSGVQAYAANDSGLNVVNAGGRNVLLNTGPSLRLVSFPNHSPLAASEIATLDDFSKQSFLLDAAGQSTLLKTELYSRGTTNAPPMLLAPEANTHYYVLVSGLGAEAQTKLGLTLEVLNSAGFPVAAGGSNAVPGRLAESVNLQAVGLTNLSANYPRQLSAHRLSEDRSHPLHTIYLAGPIVIADRTLSTNQATEVQAQLERNIVRSGRSLWVGIDPGSTNLVAPTSVFSIPANRRFLPGVSVFANIIHDERPLIVIPGIAGSHLENGESFLSVLLSERWPGYLSNLQKELTLDPDEEGKQISASDMIRQIPEEYNILAGSVLPLLGVKKAIYQPLIKYLIDELGYIEYDYISEPGISLFPRPERFAARRTLEGMVATEIARGPNLFVFPYDWRLDSATNAVKLAEYLKLIQTIHPGVEQVDIVAHSMGGLIARRFILDNPGVVGRCITLGTPFLGAPKAIAALETGDFDDTALNLIINKPLLKKLAEFFPAVHQLLPSKGYFDIGGQPLGEGGWDFDGDGATSEDYDYQNYRLAIDEVFHSRTNVSPVLTNEVFHSYFNAANPTDKQDDWKTDATGVEFFHIYGVQSVPNTIGKVRLSRTMRPVEVPADLRLALPNVQSTDGDVDLPVSPPLLSEDAFVMHPRLDLVRVEGDGTVPVLSASRVGPGGNLNAPGARLLKLESLSKSEDEGADHNGMLANPQLHEWVGEILRGGDPAPVPAPFSPASTGGKPFVHVEVVNAEPETAYAVDRATGKDSQGIKLAGTALNFLSAVPFLPGFGDGDKNLYAVEFSIADSDYDIFFTATEQPVSIIVRIGSGSEITTKVIRRDLVFTSGTKVKIVVTAGTGAFTIDPPGESRFPIQTLLGDNANNETNPVNDYELGHELTELIFNPFDDTTPSGDITVFGAYDDGADNDIDSEIFYRVPAARIAVDSLESKGFFTVAKDANGNLSDPQKAQKKPTQAIDCALLEAKRNAILDVIKQGLNLMRIQGWLLDYQHVSILEQGSGTCLWAGQNACTLCSDVYSPKESDHDYEVFLRVFVNGVPGDFTARPHLENNRRGDWYWKRPVVVNGVRQYTTPAGSVLTLPDSGVVETPAQVITRTLNAMVEQLGYDKKDESGPWSYPILPDISFFPVRFEHFTNAVLDLELPPADGGDPIGDAGLGRQMLLLKWLLEGTYVPVVDPPIYQGESLDLILSRMKDRGDLGISTAEGYEWAQLQLHASLGSGLMLRVVNPNELFDPEKVNRDFLYNLNRKQIKKAGKAAIRAALALIVGTDKPGRSDLLFSVDRALMASLNLNSFEQVIQFLADQDPALFAPYDARMEDFVRAKLADQAFMDELLADECELNQFLADSVNFIFKVNAETQEEWELRLSSFPAEELFFRTNNVQTLRDGFPAVGKAGLTELLDETSVTLPVRLINDSTIPLDPVIATMSVSDTVAVTLNTNLAARSSIDLKNGPFTLTRSILSGAPAPVLLTVTSASITDEVRIGNNWLGLESYILDLADPCEFPDITMTTPQNLTPGDPEAALLFRKSPFFYPGFNVRELAALFEIHFGEPVDRIYVVGSQMLGAADAKSDIDIVFVTDLPLDKHSDSVFPFFKAINPQLNIPAEAKHLGNPAYDPDAVDIGDVSPDPNPSIGARRLPKAGTLDPFFETIYSVNRFGFRVWPE